MAKQRYVVGCNRHGVESSEWAGKQIVVGPPKNKKDRQNGGCPLCKAATRTKPQGETV